MPEDDDHPFLLLAQWAPKGHGLITVKDYDVYYRKTPSSHRGYRITHNAVPGVVSHGVPDWLYEGKFSKTSMNHTLRTFIAIFGYIPKPAYELSIKGSSR